MAGVKGRSGRRPVMRTLKRYLAEALDKNSKALIDKAVQMGLDGDRDMLKELIAWGAGRPRTSTEVSGTIDLGISAGELQRELARQEAEDKKVLDSVRVVEVVNPDNLPAYQLK